MNKLTVTDKTDVALMEIEDIRKWISLHKRALKNSDLQEHWEDIQNDLSVLRDEYDLRNPLIVALKEMNVHLGNIETHLRLLVQIKEKEKEDGKDET